jgi:hypothetical protein
MGIVGWELPDRTTVNGGVYVFPVVAEGRGLEVRCHLADDEPNPETDQLLGMVTIPAELFGLED